MPPTAAHVLTAVLLLAVPALALPSPGGTPALPACPAEGVPGAAPCSLWASRAPMGPANEVHVALNPLDPQHVLVVAKDYGLGANGDCRPNGAWHVASASYVTFDGGATWQVARVPAPYPNGGAASSPLAYRCGSDPVALFGPDGTAYYVLLNFQYTGGRQASIAVARSPDGGITWPAGDIRVLHTAGGDDKQWGAVGRDGRVHVVWTDLGTGRILHARSYASASPSFAFEAPRQLGSVGGGNPAVVVATGSGSEVLVAWRAGSGIVVRRSLDAGATFEPARTALTVQPYASGGPPRLPFMPQLAVDADPASPFAGRAYLVWPDAREGDSSVWLSWSADTGLSWSAPVRVDDNLLPARRQVMPQVSVAPAGGGGRVDVAWMDERDGLPAAGANAGPLAGGTWRAYLASSGDGGATWGASVAVSEVPLVAAWSPHQDGSVFIGDYIGLASTADAAWPAFPGNGADRLLQGLPPEDLDRADAYVARVPR